MGQDNANLWFSTNFSFCKGNWHIVHKHIMKWPNEKREANFGLEWYTWGMFKLMPFQADLFLIFSEITCTLQRPVTASYILFIV